MQLRETLPDLAYRVLFVLIRAENALAEATDSGLDVELVSAVTYQEIDASATSTGEGGLDLDGATETLQEREDLKLERRTEKLRELGRLKAMP